MTNEEYLQQYCKQCHDKSMACESSEYCVHCQYRNDVSNALKWKDKQFKEYLEKKRDELAALSQRDFYDTSNAFGGAKYLNEIINELFNAD